MDPGKPDVEKGEFIDGKWKATSQGTKGRKTEQTGEGGRRSQQLLGTLRAGPALVSTGPGHGTSLQVNLVGSSG